MPGPAPEMLSRVTLRPGSALRLLPLTAPRLLDQLGERIRYLHYSRSTEDTTMIYTHVLRLGGGAVRSPLDVLPADAAP